MTDDVVLPEAVPGFKAHFTDPIYDDQAEEFAPFGTDEGWDLLDEWGARRGELSDETTVAQLIRESGFEGIEHDLHVPEGPGIPSPGGQVDAAVIVIGAGFTLLRLTGRIDDEGKKLVFTALDVLIARYGPLPVLQRQHDDLKSWQGSSAMG